MGQTPKVAALLAAGALLRDNLSAASNGDGDDIANNANIWLDAIVDWDMTAAWATEDES